MVKGSLKNLDSLALEGDGIFLRNPIHTQRFV